MTAEIMIMFLSSKRHKENKTEPPVYDKEEHAMSKLSRIEVLNLVMK